MSLRDRSAAGHSRRRVATVATAIAVLAAAYLTAGVAVLLPSPGYATARLAFALLVVLVAWVGAAGAYFDRPPVVILTAVTLALLGFWQAVLWIFMLPAAVGLVVAGLLLAHLSGT